MNNALQKDDADLINIEQLYLDGTGQMIYDERSRLVLWDYVPNTASRDDIVKAMKVNLEQEEPEMIKEFSFSINDEDYEKTVTGTGPYKTAFTYDLLPDFTGDGMEQARNYANAHGIKVTFNGTSGYVVSQSLPANKRIDLISGSVVLTLSGSSSYEEPETNNNNTTTTQPTTPNSKPEEPDTIPTEPEESEDIKDPNPTPPETTTPGETNDKTE